MPEVVRSGGQRSVQGTFEAELGASRGPFLSLEGILPGRGNGDGSSKSGDFLKAPWSQEKVRPRGAQTVETFLRPSGPRTFSSATTGPACHSHVRPRPEQQGMS